MAREIKYSVVKLDVDRNGEPIMGCIEGTYVDESEAQGEVDRLMENPKRRLLLIYELVKH